MPVHLQVVHVEPAPDSQQDSGPSALVLPEPEAICDAPDWAKPNRTWVQQFVADFQQLRQQAQQAYEQQCECFLGVCAVFCKDVGGVLKAGPQGTQHPLIILVFDMN